LIDEYIIAFDEALPKVDSLVTLDQILTFFSKDDGKREHADVERDDLIAGMRSYQLRKALPGKMGDIETSGSYDDWFKMTNWCNGRFDVL
jgi:hypothetical protein